MMHGGRVRRSSQRKRSKMHDGRVRRRSQSRGTGVKCMVARLGEAHKAEEQE